MPFLKDNGEEKWKSLPEPARATYWWLHPMPLAAPLTVQL